MSKRSGSWFMRSVKPRDTAGDNHRLTQPVDSRALSTYAGPMRIAVVQIQTGADKLANLDRVRETARAAAAEGTKLIVFPEATSQAFGTGRLDHNAEDLDGPFATGVRELAQELEVVIVVGMFSPADTIEAAGKTINRVYNLALVTGGGQHTGYQKIHTYDAFNYAESDTVHPGEELLNIDVFGVPVGVAVCYDVRFPEMFRSLAQAGAKAIVLPTSWADGPDKVAQWRTLTAARALDSTSWIIAAGQARPGGNAKAGEASGPTGVGHSCVVDPAGRRVAEAGYTEETLLVDLDLELVDKVRKTLPVLDGLAEAATTTPRS